MQHWIGHTPGCATLDRLGAALRAAALRACRCFEQGLDSYVGPCHTAHGFLIAPTQCPFAEASLVKNENHVCCQWMLQDIGPRDGETEDALDQVPERLGVVVVNRCWPDVPEDAA